MAITQPLSTKQDILQLLLKSGPTTAQDLADHLDISPQAIRRHLKDLEDERLIEYESVQTGMGRPQHFYRLTTIGRAHFPNHYDQFAISLLDTVAKTVGPDQFSQILQKQWEKKAIEYQQQVGQGSIVQRLESLVELRRAEGYMAEWHRLEPDQQTPNHNHPHSKFILIEHNCVISNVAETFPSVCTHELEMFATILPDCFIERTHWLIDGEHRCGYLITKKSS